MHPPITDSDISALQASMLSEDLDRALALCERLDTEGVPVESLYLNLLAPAARALHQRWESDEIDFVQVTMAVSMLERLMHRMGPTTATVDGTQQLRREVMLVPVSGSQHTLGLQMVAAFFRQAQWGVWSASSLTVGDLQHAVSQRWFDVVGFSIGAEPQVAALARSVETVRRWSKNRHVGILAGGPVLAHRPGLAAEVGADASAADALEALIAAERLVRRQAQRAA
jgi:methanogenic corrinoid protein MtbC1